MVYGLLVGPILLLWRYEASIEIRKGRDQLGPCRMGVVETFYFKDSQAS